METGRLEIMDRTGDTKVFWDRNNSVEVAAAKAQFDLLSGKGYAAFKLNSDGLKGELIREFDPNAERIQLVPAKAGG